MSPFMLTHGVVRRADIIKLALNSSPLFFTVMSMSSRSECLPIMCLAFIKIILKIFYFAVGMTNKKTCFSSSGTGSV